MATPKPSQYKEHVIVFLDIIGFKDKVRRAKKDPSEIREIGETLQDVKRWVSQLKDYSQGLMAGFMFSDTIVISCPCGSSKIPAPVNIALSATVGLQYKLTLKGHFLRGAIAIGDHFEEDDIMFGPAFIQAYEMEKIAVWPRVIVHPMAVVRSFSQLQRKTIRRSPTDFERLLWALTLRRDASGLTYLDYLTGEFLAETPMAWIEEWQGLPVTRPYGVGILSAHKSAIEKAAKQKDVRANIGRLAKYYAVAHYHNAVVETLEEQFAQCVENGKPPPDSLMEYLYDFSTCGLDSKDRKPKDRQRFCKGRFDLMVNQIELLRQQKISLHEQFSALYRT